MATQLTAQHRRRISEGMRRSTKKIGAPRTVADRTCETCRKTFRPEYDGSGRARTGRGSRYCSRSCWKQNPDTGPQSAKWNHSGRFVTRGSGKPDYVFVRRNGKWRQEHGVIAERVLGRGLHRGEVVHHVNGIGTDNRNINLLICTQAYHALLHQRMAAAWMRGHLGGR